MQGYMGEGSSGLTAERVLHLPPAKVDEPPRAVPEPTSDALLARQSDRLARLAHALPCPAIRRVGLHARAGSDERGPEGRLARDGRARNLEELDVREEVVGRLEEGRERAEDGRRLGGGRGQEVEDERQEEEDGVPDDVEARVEL